MGIFHKTCPECMAQNPVNAPVCDCGYDFDADSGRKTRNALEAVADEEKLYHDYLVARVAQAEAAAKTARKQAHLDPENHTKAADALLAEQALMAARGELADQELRLRNAELHIRQKVFHRPKASAPAPKPAAGQRGTGAVIHMARSAERKRVAAKPRSNPAVNETKAPAHPVPTTPVAATAPKAGPVQAEAPRKLALPPTPAKTANVHKPAGPLAKPAPTVADRPGEAFRAAQAARAEKVVAMAQRHTSKAPAPANRVPTPTMATPVRPAPVATAPKPAPATTKECPHCWGVVPVAAPKCRCGYEFSGGPDLPGLTLSAADLALFKGLDLGVGSKPR